MRVMAKDKKSILRLTLQYHVIQHNDIQHNNTQCNNTSYKCHSAVMTLCTSVLSDVMLSVTLFYVTLIVIMLSAIMIIVMVPPDTQHNDIHQLSCWSKIPHGSPTISKILVNFHQDFMTSVHNNFFLGKKGRS